MLSTSFFCVGSIEMAADAFQYAGIWLFGNYYTTHKPTISELAILVPVVTLLMIFFAWLVMVLYDTPIRRLLARWLRTAKP